MVRVAFSSSNMDLETYNYEVIVGHEAQIGQMTAFPEMAKMEFLRIVTQLAQDPRPCKVRFSFMEDVWLQLDQMWKQFENYVEFANKAYVDNINI